MILLSEPPHDKPAKWPLRPAKTQNSLGIRQVWSESSQSAWRNIQSSATHWAHCEALIRLDGAQADLSLRWAHRSFCWFCHEAAQVVEWMCYVEHTSLFGALVSNSSALHDVIASSIMDWIKYLKVEIYSFKTAL